MRGVALPLTNEALLKKLKRSSRLEEWEVAFVAGLPVHDVAILRDQPVALDADMVFLVLEGWVCGHQIVGDGRRQINSFHLSGDVPNLGRLILPTDTSQYAALSSCRLGLLPAPALRELCRKSPAICQAVCGNLAIEAEIAQQWIANLGGRKSVARMAHLLCELTARMDDALPRYDRSSYAFPLTQADLGDALGLSTVHTNRVLQELRISRLIELSNGHLAIPDRERLAIAAGFDPAYLHLQPQPAFAA